MTGTVGKGQKDAWSLSIYRGPYRQVYNLRKMRSARRNVPKRRLPVRRCISGVLGLMLGDWQPPPSCIADSAALNPEVVTEGQATSPTYWKAISSVTYYRCRKAGEGSEREGAEHSQVVWKTARIPKYKISPGSVSPESVLPKRRASCTRDWRRVTLFM